MVDAVQPSLSSVPEEDPPAPSEAESLTTPSIVSEAEIPVTPPAASEAEAPTTPTAPTTPIIEEPPQEAKPDPPTTPAHPPAGIIVEPTEEVEREPLTSPLDPAPPIIVEPAEEAEPDTTEPPAPPPPTPAVEYPSPVEDPPLFPYELISIAEEEDIPVQTARFQPTVNAPFGAMEKILEEVVPDSKPEEQSAPEVNAALQAHHEPPLDKSPEPVRVPTAPYGKSKPSSPTPELEAKPEPVSEPNQSVRQSMAQAVPQAKEELPANETPAPAAEAPANNYGPVEDKPIAVAPQAGPEPTAQETVEKDTENAIVQKQPAPLDSKKGPEAVAEPGKKSLKEEPMKEGDPPKDATAVEEVPRGNTPTPSHRSRKARLRNHVPSPVHKFMLGRDVAKMAREMIAKKAAGVT